MKHRFTVPYPAADMPDISAWARSHGWRVIEHACHHEQFGFRTGYPLLFTVALVPLCGVFPNHSVEVRARSGATLIYDDVDRSMAVTLQPEPEDAVPQEPRDEIPAPR